MSVRIRWLLALVLALGACSHPPPGASAPDDLVWVAAHYTGGVSCQAQSAYRAPNTVQVLRQARVTVYATAVEHFILPDACDSPGYSAAHYALIARTDARRAARAGFQARPLPRRVPVDTLQPSVFPGS